MINPCRWRLSKPEDVRRLWLPQPLPPPAALWPWPSSFSFYFSFLGPLLRMPPFPTSNSWPGQPHPAQLDTCSCNKERVKDPLSFPSSENEREAKAPEGLPGARTPHNGSSVLGKTSQGHGALVHRPRAVPVTSFVPPKCLRLIQPPTLPLWDPTETCSFLECLLLALQLSPYSQGSRLSRGLIPAPPSKKKHHPTISLSLSGHVRKGKTGNEHPDPPRSHALLGASTWG